MSLHLTEHAIDTPTGRRVALVAAPTARIRAGRDKLEDLRRSLDTSTVDSEIVEYLRAHPAGTFSAFVFSGESEDGAGSWRFAEDLTEDERFELGYLMWRSQLPLNRFCAARGIVDNIYVNWTDAELESFSAAANRMAWELRSGVELYPEPDTPRARLARLDLFLVERQAFLLKMPLRTIMRRILPPRFARMERRAASLGAMLDGLPKGALDGTAAVGRWPVLD